MFDRNNFTGEINCLIAVISFEARCSVFIFTGQNISFSVSALS